MTLPDDAPTAAADAPRRFDRLSLGLYGAFLLWGWLLYAFGPVIQILGRETGFSAAEIGLHGTAMALGTALAGGVLAPVVRALGRRGALVLGAALVSAGGAGLTVLSALPATMAATLVLAVGGNMAIAAAQAGLVVHHAPHPAEAVTTANGLGTLVGLVGPVAIGASVAAGFGWRPVVLVTVPMSLVMVVIWLRMPASPAMTPRAQGMSVGAGRERRADAERRADRQGVLGRVVHQLPAAGWWFLLAALIGVAIESATTFWSLTLITERTGAGTAVAAAATAAFVGGMATSRLVSWWFTARYSPSRLVVAAFAVNAVGWLVLWLATVPTVAILGLALSGMGCGLLYPFAASLMLSTARGSKDSAQGLIMVALGIAVGVVPFVLGLLADAAGVHTAFLLVPALAAVGAGAAWLGASSLADS
ncbi:MFS transporter [Tessaracoccus sp. G1721]